jgi:hypothetical protein
MTDHVRSWLEPLDDGAPSADLLDRARRGPVPADDGRGDGPRRSPSRLGAAVVAIVVFLVAGVFAYQAFETGPGSAVGSRPIGSVYCPLGPPRDAIAAVGCGRAVMQAWEVAAFLSSTMKATATWRDWPIAEGRTANAWLVTFNDGAFGASVGGCSGSGTLSSYTVVISATSGVVLASDGPPPGCSTDRTIAPLVTLTSDSCAVVTPDQIAEATSSKVAGTRRLDASDMKMDTGPPYPCDFETDGKFGHIGVLSTASDPGGFEQARTKDPLNSLDVSGLGDGAFIHARGAITVAVGDGYFWIGVQHSPGADAEQTLQELSNDALKNLTRDISATPTPSASTPVDAGSTTESVMLDKYPGIRCTASIPDVVQPGGKLGLELTLENLSGSTRHDISPYAPFTASIVDADGTTWESSDQPGFGGGGYIPPEPFPPGATKHANVDPFPIEFPGPLKVTPACLGEPLPAMAVQVADPSATPAPQDAVRRAVSATNGLFDGCTPTLTGSVVGTVSPPDDPSRTLKVRCAAQVKSEQGFAVVTLVMSTPSSADTPSIPDGPLTAAGLPGSPPLTQDNGAETLAWRFVVTSTDVVPVESATHFKTHNADVMIAEYEVSQNGWKGGGATRCGGDAYVGGSSGQSAVIAFTDACAP